MTPDRSRTDPRERFAGPAHAWDLAQELAALRAEVSTTHQGHRQKTLHKGEGRTIALFSFDAGALLPEHSTAGIVSVQVIEGDLVMHVAGERMSLPQGSMLVMMPGVRHDVRAVSHAAFVLQVSLTASKP